MESDKMIFYTIIYMILFLVGVFIVNGYFENVNLKLTCQTGNVQYTLLAARLINSATCLAWDQPVPGSREAEAKFGGDWALSASVATGQNYQARAGVVDLNKIQPGVLSLGACMGSVVGPENKLTIRDFNVKAYDSSGQFLREATFGQSALIKNPITDTFIVKLWDGRSLSDGRVVIKMQIPEGEKKCTG